MSARDDLAGLWASAAAPNDVVPIAMRRTILGLGLAASALFFVLSMLRWTSYHDTTFDLAFYARLAWGVANGSRWEPIVNAPVWGLHLVWIFEWLGWIGAVFGAVPTLLVAQSLAVGLTVVPLSRIGARHLGPSGALAAALAFLLHPNVSAVACDEFHPGTVAVLPIAWAADAVDRKNAPAVLLASFGIILCREDLALVGMFAAASVALAAHRSGAHRDRRLAGGSALFSLVYVLVFVLVLHPLFAPRVGSLGLHFGHHGSSVPAVLLDFATHPSALAAHLAADDRWLYPILVCAPLALLPFLAPEGFVITASVLAIALLSEFPTTTCLDSHYLTPALPFLVRAAAIGATRIPRLATWRVAPWIAASVTSHLIAGATPLSLHFDPAAFEDDVRTLAMRAITTDVPATASVQAPDTMLAHLAERLVLHRAPPPEMNAQFVVLDLAHRRAFRHHEELVRTDEEPIARFWLARDDHALIAAVGDFVLLERGLDPREGVDIERYVIGHASATDVGTRLTECLRLESARLEDGAVELVLVARGACPDDLALRIGTGLRPRRVDLIADGLFSPAHFRSGDRIRSTHVLSRLEEQAISHDGLRIGAIRASGARPVHDDPLSIEVALSP